MIENYEDISQWNVGWAEVDQYLKHLVNKIKEYEIPFTGIYGVPRGGMLLATLLSYKINLPLLSAPMHNCIIIDDIADSGRTLLHYTKNDTQFNDYFITTMFYHERSMVKPDFYLYTKKDEWITFPWEV